jgi:hypothetical protein
MLWIIIISLAIILGIILLFVIVRKIIRFTPKANFPNKRIAIIGSGPSGIISAKKLQERGYKNITMYGKFNDSQVETFNIDGVVVDTQACFLHSGYENSVGKLCKEENFELDTIETNVFNKPPNFQMNLNIFNIIKFFLVVIKHYYITKNPDILSMNARDFANKYGFKWPSEFIFLSGQLYGYKKDITTHSALSWYKSYNMLSSDTKTRIVKDGYQPLFRSILDRLNIKKIERLVHSVVKSSSDNSMNLTIDNGEIHNYDTVIVACAPVLLKSPIDSIIRPTDYDHTRIFYILYTSLVPRNIGVYYNYEVLNNQIYNKIIAYRCYGKTTEGLYIYGALGYVTKDIDEMELYKQILPQFVSVIKAPIHKQIYWIVIDYNYRWSYRAIKESRNKLANKFQGKDNVWYTTSPFCHWNIDGIYEHATSICKRV